MKECPSPPSVFTQLCGHECHIGKTSAQVSQGEQTAISKFKLEFEAAAQEARDTGNKKVILTKADIEAIVAFLDAAHGEGADGYDWPSSSTLVHLERADPLGEGLCAEPGRRG